MEIQKIFSEIDTNERLYSVLLTEEEMKMFTKWDMTDQYKGMKDSDILAEKKRSNVGTYVKAGKAGVIGTGIGAGVGAGLGAVLGRKIGMNTKKAAGVGAAIGGTLGVTGGLAATHEERANNRFANKRLNEMKYQAKRRDIKDWRNQTNSREGYTY
jgi:hypothetical protein